MKLLGLELEDGVRIDVPHIKGCAGFLECTVEKEIEVGEHTFFIARIVYAAASEKHFDSTWKENSEILLHVGSKKFSYLREIIQP
jgi:flavin reductase (DIM6/NTAB) family NADH-FMN oxidoreductase RutF